MGVSNGFVVGWHRAVVGREQDAVELFAVANNFYEARKKGGDIRSYEHIFLRPHGGDLNGFTLVQGDSAKIDALLRSDEWLQIESKAILLLEGFGVIRATTGPDSITDLLRLYTNAIPRR
jgi:hypothetical protein